MRECGDGRIVRARGTGSVSVEDMVMFKLACRGVTMRAVVRAMPMRLPFRRGLFEDLGAVRAEDVISEAEVLVQHHCSFGNPLVAVITLLFVSTMCAIICEVDC